MAKLKSGNLLKVITGGDSMIPEWQRTSFFDKKNKTIYIPAIKADVINAGKCRKYGQVIKYQDQAYLPLTVIQKLHPDQDFSEIERRILEALENVS